MKSSKLFYITFIISSLLISSLSYADTCYDPNYNAYYYCEEDDYIAPVIAGVFLGAILSDDGGAYRGHYRGGYRRGGHGGRGGRHH